MDRLFALALGAGCNRLYDTPLASGMDLTESPQDTWALRAEAEALVRRSLAIRERQAASKR